VVPGVADVGEPVAAGAGGREALATKGAWRWSPPTRPSCRAPLPGTWSLTCHGPAGRARRKARTRPRPWPRSPASTASATGSSRATSRSGTSWADFQVRSDTAIRRHQVLVNCAFSFCCDAWFADPAPPPRRRRQTPTAERGGPNPPARLSRRHPGPGAARRPRLAHTVDHAAALVDSMVERAPAAARPDGIPASRPRPAPLHPELTNYR
jgi:hypothetical protein